MKDLIKFMLSAVFVAIVFVIVHIIDIIDGTYWWYLKNKEVK